MYQDYQNQKKQQDSIELFPVPQRRYYPERQYLRPKPQSRKKQKQQRRQTPKYMQPRINSKNQFVESVNRLNKIGKQYHTTAGSMVETFTKLVTLVGVISLGFIGIKAYLENEYGKQQEANVYGGDEGQYIGAEYDNSTEKGRIKNKIIAEANKQGVDPALALAQAEAESNFNQNARSQTGAIGVFQLMPDTAKGLGVNPYDLDQNIQGGVKYLKQQLKKYNGDVNKALAAYNAGPSNVDKYGGVPPFKETQNYVAKINKNYDKYKNELEKMSKAPAGKQSTLENISKKTNLDKGVTYSDKSNITSHTKLTTGTNEKYNANIGEMGTFDGYTINSAIGQRYVPNGGSSFHKGLDLKFAQGTPVKAFCSGYVTHVGVLSGFGRCIIINDDYGYRHVYGHLSAYNVSDKQHVTKGQVIGYSGGSGTLDGKFVENRWEPHLHYGIWKPGGTSDKAYIDPRTYMYPPEKENVPQTKSDNDKVNKGNKQVTPSTQKPTTQNPSTKVKQETPKIQKAKPTKQTTPTVISVNSKKQTTPTKNIKDIGKPDEIKARVQHEDKRYKK